MDTINTVSFTPKKDSNAKPGFKPGFADTPISVARKSQLLPAFEPKLSEFALPPSSPSRPQVGGVSDFSSKDKLFQLKSALTATQDSHERGRYFITPEPSSSLGRGFSEADAIFDEEDGEGKHPQIPSSPVFEAYSDEEEVDEEDIGKNDSACFTQESQTSAKKTSSPRVTRLEYEFREPQYEFAKEAGPNSKNNLHMSSSSSKVPFNILSPFSYITTTLAIPRTGKEVTLGRSSKANDFMLSSSNRLASRIHVRAEYIQTSPGNNERVKFTCEGWNGCTLVVPTFKRINKTEFEKMREGKESLQTENAGSSTESRDKTSFVYVPNGVTDYIIPRGHNVEVDYVDGITINVRGDLVMVKLVNDNPIKYDEFEQDIKTSLKRKADATSEGSKKRVVEKKKKIEAKVVKKNTPKKEDSSKTEKPKSIVEDERVPQKVEQEPVKQNDAKITKSLQKEFVDYPRIQHLVSNHLAFSRLHSMPLSSIHNSISALKSVDPEDLRYVLGNTAWIGVVARKGKDAAGRPLEEEYYYVYDADIDNDRKTMVEKIGARGSGGLRACRKTHKQYYWKMPAKR